MANEAKMQDVRAESDSLLMEHISRSSRLVVMGELMAGVAHNFGNALMSSSATLELLMMRTAGDPLMADMGKTVRRALERVGKEADLIARIVEFSREAGPATAAVSPRRVAEDALALCATHPLARRVRLVNEVGKGAALVKADRRRLEEVLVNLVINAIEASEQGSVRIGCQSRTDEYVEITVVNQGRGIAPEDLPHIFEPFFSRRAHGMVGTGLGLSFCLLEVRLMGGSLDVQSTPGQGSVFSLRLPKWLDA